MAVLVFVLGVVSLLWESFVFQTIWNWFLPSVGVPLVDFSVACGIVLLIGLVTTKTDLKNPPMEDLLLKCIYGMFSGLIILALAFLAHTLL